MATGAAYAPRLFLLGLGRLFDHAAAAVKAIRRNAMAQMGFAAARIDRQRGACQLVMRTMHAALGRRFAAFLNGHFLNLLKKSLRLRVAPAALQQRTQIAEGPLRLLLVSAGRRLLRHHITGRLAALAHAM